MNKNSNKKTEDVSRRDFIKASAALAAMGVATNRIFAAGSEKIRVALVGCGGRGNFDIDRCIEAAKHLNLNMEVVATADWFKSRAEETGKKYSVPPERCFSGGDCYKKLLATDADIVMLVTPPNFRPVHFEAAIKAGKHVFMEKPVAVDPPGARKIIEVGELAKQKKLAVVVGTQRRHNASYRRSQYAVEQGAIGKIVGGCLWWCGGALWYKKREPNESDADYMVRNWVSFAEMSGDHIVEQHVHNLDVANWYIGHPPVVAIGFGGRARRKTGNQFDFFSVQYDYEEDVHIHSMCRQVNNTYGRVGEHFVGTEGSAWGGGKVASKKAIDIPNFPEYAGRDGECVQEHIDLFNGILKGEPLNEAKNIGESTLTALMGRISAYTGQAVRWSELAGNKESQWYNLTLKPTAEDFEKGTVTAPPDDIAPVPGKD
jgi:predicted dehydrogenase